MTDDPFVAAIHGDGDVDDGPDLAPPLHTTTTFDRSSQDELVYGRYHHVTRRRLEAVLGALEGGIAITYPSGMAAISSLLRHLRPDRIALPDDVYYVTRQHVEAEAAHGAWELGAPLVDSDVVWVETPSNPKCLVTDIAEVAGGEGTVVVDSTFATPILQRPLDLGADFVVHATTKAINGHSDAMGGVVVTRDGAAAEALLAARDRDGTIPGSLETWLTLRGVRTLPLRAMRQSETASAVAEWLVDRVPTVWYPGLADHPGADVASRQMRGPGGLLSFEMGGYEEAADVVRRLRVFRKATSLGGVESLVEHRREVDDGAPEGLIRLSIGLESAESLVGDLDQALGG